VANGSQGAPAINFASSSSTGIFSPATGKIALATAGNLFLHNKGASNTALGASALAANSPGSGNTALGDIALANNTGSLNTAVGAGALDINTGNNNTAVGGFGPLGRNTTGSDNTAVGSGALGNNTTGSNNIAIGKSAAAAPSAPSNSIFIGNFGAGADTNTIKIGTQGTQTSTFIAGIRGATVSGNAVLVNSSGRLGTTTSSRRYKEEVEPMRDMSAALMKLRPVTFRYKQPYDDGAKTIQYGLIAEEVAEVLPDLAVVNADGRPETVKYHLLPSLLLAAYQRQSETVRSQAEHIAALERRLAVIEARLANPDRREATARRLD
jgi:hypothetical protein